LVSRGSKRVFSSSVTEPAGASATNACCSGRGGAVGGEVAHLAPEQLAEAGGDGPRRAVVVGRRALGAAEVAGEHERAAAPSSSVSVGSVARMRVSSPMTPALDGDVEVDPDEDAPAVERRVRSRVGKVGTAVLSDGRP
jgi:hypothetical protein